ncbi:MAG: hypothetical protein ACRCTF_04270 [Bacteroidales bacterium]
MKKNLRNLLSIALFGGAAIANSQVVTYNFTEIFNTAGQSGSVAVVSPGEADPGYGLVIKGTSKVTKEANNKISEGVLYTTRLKTGGKFDKGGEPTDCSFGFPVSGNGTIEFVALTGSNSDLSREVSIYLAANEGGETKDIQTGYFPVASTGLDKVTVDGVEAEDIPVHSYEYVGDPGIAYVYSKINGNNFYMVRYTPTSTGVSKDQLTNFVYNGHTVTVADAVALNVYNVAGANAVSTNGSEVSMDRLGRGVYVVEAVMANGQRATAKIMR